MGRAGLVNRAGMLRMVLSVFFSFSLCLTLTVAAAHTGALTSWQGGAPVAAALQAACVAAADCAAEIGAEIGADEIAADDAGDDAPCVWACSAFAAIAPTSLVHVAPQTEIRLPAVAIVTTHYGITPAQHDRPPKRLS